MTVAVLTYLLAIMVLQLKKNAEDIDDTDDY